MANYRQLSPDISEREELLFEDARPIQMKSFFRAGTAKVLLLLFLIYFAANYVLVAYNGPTVTISETDSYENDVTSSTIGQTGALPQDVVGEVAGSIAEPPHVPTVTEIQEAIARQERCDALVSPYNIHNENTIDDDTCLKIAKECGISSCKRNMDVVVLWVNGSDPEQLRLRNKTLVMLQNDENLWTTYSKYMKSAGGENRFRDFGQLKIGLRSVEKNLPYARRIFMVTNNQVPEYLNVYHPRIRMVDHKDLLRWTNVTTPFPAMFNSMAIESMIHNIPTLSSPFLYMQDDMFYGVPVPLRMFYDDQGGVARPTWKASLTRNPKDALFFKCAKNSLHALVDLKTIPEDKYLNATRGTLSDHGPTMWYIDIGKKIWEYWRPTLTATVGHPFRHDEDMNLQALHMHLGRYMGRYWFKEVALTTFKTLTANHTKDIATFDNLEKNRAYVVCLNDDFPSDTPDWAFAMIQERLNTFFPTKAEFEL